MLNLDHCIALLLHRYVDQVRTRSLVIRIQVFSFSLLFKIKCCQKTLVGQYWRSVIFFAVEELVQTPDRLAMRTVEPLRESIFRKRISQDQKWKATYEAVCNAYENLAPNFSIRHDDFGGYKLVYSGKNVILPPIVLKRNPVGFVKEVPDGAVTNLSVMTSERTGKQLHLLGPMRFVNSECSPDCEYDFSSESGILQLRLKKRLIPGDELLVRYGPDFFKRNACLCRTCNLRSAELSRQNQLIDNELIEMLTEVVSETIEEETKANIKISSPVCKPKRRRIKCRELVEQVNELEESPLSSTESPREYLLSAANVVSVSSADKTTDNFENESVLQLSPNEKTQSVADLNDFSFDATPKVLSLTLSRQPESKEFSADEIKISTSPIRASSPLACDTSFNFSLSAIGENSAAYSMPEQLENLDELLFEGTETTLSEASSLTDLFCSRYNLSDECSRSLHTLIKGFLSSENKFPSGYSHVNGIKKQFEEQIRLLEKNSEYSLCVLSYRFQIIDIVKRNLSQISQYSEFRKMNPFADLNAQVCPIVELNVSKCIDLNLLMFSDGVNIKKSTFKKEVWPLWIQVADLPPKLRMSRKNIVLAALFVGDKHPEWEKVVPTVRDEITAGIQIEINDDVKYNFRLKVRLLICDLGAKSHMLNMLKFNGYYGCHFCTVPGKTIGKTHAYYQYCQQGASREPSLNDIYVRLAECETLGVNDVPNVVGVKGKSAFASIVDGLPLTAHIDYTHCILLDVFSDLLKLCFRTLNATQKRNLATIVSKMSCPREMISYSRKIRALDEMSQFKANEL